jgi:NADPH2:quinone reductase
MKRSTQAFQYHQHGGADVLAMRAVPLPPPGAGEVQIRHTAIGVNYLDLYQRSGADKSVPLPAGIGVEGVGIVEIADPANPAFAVGDRVAYVGGPPGSYALRRNIPAARLIRLPDRIGDTTAAATLFKGLTVEYLIHRCVAVKAGQTVLLHAAAGGVGTLASKWLSALGARVIGTVGSEAKLDQARTNGCVHVLLSGDPDLAKKVQALTGGVDVVYDSVGATTFMASLDSLRPRGTLVSFGAASGPPPEISVGELAKRGSLFLTRPSIAHYTADPGEYQQAANRLFDAMADGTVTPSQITTLDLAEAAEAHRMIEGRQTTGSVVLLPNPSK